MHHLDAGLALVLRDLDVTGLPRPRIDWTPWQDAVPAESAMLWAGSSSATGVWWDLALPAEEALAHLADQVQDWAVEELAHHGLPTNWPVCPAHPANHPRSAVVQGARAVWLCPRADPDDPDDPDDAATATPIGQWGASGSA